MTQPTNTTHIPSPKISGGANDIYLPENSKVSGGNSNIYLKESASVGGGANDILQKEKSGGGVKGCACHRGREREGEGERGGEGGSHEMRMI